MATPLSANLRFLVGKLESSPGSLATLTSEDFNVRIKDPVVTHEVELDDENAKWARGDHGEEFSITGVKTATVTFSIRCVTGATAAAAPNWAKFLKACGQKEIAYTTTGIGWQPRKDCDAITITLAIYDLEMGATPKALCTTIKGCVGNCVIGADGVGKPWLATYSFRGVISSVADVANASLLMPYVIDTQCADKMLSNVAYVGAVPEKISSFSLDYGNEINPVYDQSDASGVAYFAITARRPRLSMNPLATVAATRDVWTQWTSGTTGPCSTMPLGIGDTGDDRKFFVLAPKTQLLTSPMAIREGLVSWDQNYKLLPNGVTGSLTDDDLAAETTVELLQGKRA